MNFKKKTIEPDKNLRNIGPRIILLLDKLIFNLLAWNVLLRVFFFLNYLINPDLIFSGAKIFQISHERGFVLTGMASLVAGFSWLFEDVIFYKYLSRKGLGNLFIIRFFFIVIMLAFVLLLFTVYHYQSSFFSDISEYLILLKGFFLNRTTVYLFLIGIIISIGINFFKAIRQKVGYEKFFRIISGYYRKPKEENRIFIFIDLISSTHYAELLGHKKYSAFLQECFKHLGILEIKYRAMQYQIVGDEVVLSWSADKEKNFRYAVNFYYEFQALLSKKAGFFKKEYGVIPSFTASINAGKIMVAEVGTVKSEIAFHGDVLNTAARIQKQCKSYDRSLLVTDSFVEKFKPFSQGYKTEWVTHDPLTGKSKRVGVYAVFPENGNDFQSEKIKTKKKVSLTGC